MAAHSPRRNGTPMNRSFAQFHWFLCATVGALLLCSGTAAHALAQTVLSPEIASAQQAVERADRADADQYAPDLLGTARTTLAQAQAAASSRRDRKMAPELAIRALLDADLARARSNEAVARARWQQRRVEIDELQRNLGMEENR